MPSVKSIYKWFLKIFLCFRCSDAEISSKEKYPTFTRMEPPDTQVWKTCQMMRFSRFWLLAHALQSSIISKDLLLYYVFFFNLVWHQVQTKQNNFKVQRSRKSYLKIQIAKDKNPLKLEIGKSRRNQRFVFWNFSKNFGQLHITFYWISQFSADFE